MSFFFCFFFLKCTRYKWVIANAAAHVPADQPQMLAEELELAKEAAGLLPLQISRLQQYTTAGQQQNR